MMSKKVIWHVFKSWAPLASVRNELVERHWNEIIDTFRERVESGDLYLNRTASGGQEPTGCSLRRADIKFIDSRKLEYDAIETDIAVATTIQLKYVDDMGNVVEDENTVEQWFKINVLFFLDSSEHQYEYIRESIYSDKSRMEDRLDPYMIPYRDERSRESAAERILKKYYSDALVNPQKIEGRKLAESMGLTVRELRLSAENTILGMIYFFSGSVKVYDPETKEYFEMDVPANTILIDPVAIKATPGASEDGTIIHECVHYSEHGEFQWLQHHRDDDAANITCPSDTSGSYPAELAPLWQIEYQAAQIGLSVQLPVQTVRKKVNEQLNSYANMGIRGDQLVYVYPGIIEDLAKFYGVSKQAVRTRLLDLGYQEAKGALNYVNRGYSPPHVIRRGTCDKTQTYTVSVKEALEVYRENEEFRALLKTGQFVYVEGHFCLNDDEYVYIDYEGNLSMTIAGRDHINDCCLKFEKRKIIRREKLYKDGVLHHEVIHTRQEVSWNEPGIPLMEQVARLKKEADRRSDELRKTPTFFCDAMDALMIKYGVTNQELAESMGLGPTKISLMRTQVDPHTTKKQVLAFCLVFHLPPQEMEDMMEMAGHKFTKASEDIMLQMLYNSKYNGSLEEFNNLLELAGYGALTKDSCAATEEEKGENGGNKRKKRNTKAQATTMVM